MRFDVGSGSTYATSSLNQWQSGAYYTTSGAVGLVAQSNGVCYFTGVHLTAGTTGSAYVPRAYGSELVLAQRYRGKTFKEGTAPAQSAGLVGALCTKTPVATAYPQVDFHFPVPVYQGGGSTLAITTYNPSASNANFRDVTASSDVTVSVDPSTALGPLGVQITSGSTVSNAGDQVCIQAYYDSGFN